MPGVAAVGWSPQSVSPWVCLWDGRLLTKEPILDGFFGLISSALPGSVVLS